jgi:hypothetical protein
MTDKWMIRGQQFGNCNCNYGCPCQFNAPSTYGKCEAVATYTIEEGYFNDINLDNQSFVQLLQWPGEVADGNGREQIIIDERASPQQREAIRKIAHGECAAPGSNGFSIYASTMSDMLETLYLPIEVSIDVDSRKANVEVKGTVESRGVPITDPFSGDEFRAGIHLPGGFEFVYAEMGSGTSRVNAGINLQLNDSFGVFSKLHMNQDGLIRD